MHKHELKKEFRARLRELTQGFIQHCEISRNLIGQIERTLEHDGVKYGVPVFTFHGPSLPELDTRYIGVAAHNRANETSSAESVLQVIERLVLSPGVATGTVLRLLPVTDPVALELGAPAEDPEAQAVLNDIRREFDSRALDGLVEVQSTPVELLTIDAVGDPAFNGAVVEACEALARLSAESSAGLPVELGETHGRNPGGGFLLRLNVPETWPQSLAVHWVSQFLIVFFRSHTDALLRRVASAQAKAWGL